MALLRFFLFPFIHIALFSSLCFAADPSVSYEFRLSYITASPLGVPQQVLFLIFLYLLSSFRSLLICFFFFFLMWVSVELFSGMKWFQFCFTPFHLNYLLWIYSKGRYMNFLYMGSVFHKVFLSNISSMLSIGSGFYCSRRRLKANLLIPGFSYFICSALSWFWVFQISV